MALGSRSYWALIVVLFVVLGYFSLSNLSESPPTWFDEGLYLQVAENVALHGTQEIQIAPQQFVSTEFVTGGYPFLEPISWSFSLFGPSLLHARLVMVGFIFAAVFAFFFLIYSLFGATPAALALLLLVTFPPLYGQGKNALGEVPGLFFLGVFFAAVHQLEKRNYRGTWLYLLVGLSAGLCVSTKPIYFLLGGAVALAVLLYRRSIAFHWGPIFAGLIAFLIPLALWFKFQFFSSDSAGWVLSYYANPYGIQNLNAEILTNALRFLHEASPLYFMLLMAAWIVSYIVRKRDRSPITLTESIAFIFGVLVWIAYLRTAGWYRYFFVAEIPALVFLPHAAAAIGKGLCTQFTRQELYLKYAALALVLLLALVQTYQMFDGSWVAAHNERTTTHQLVAYVATLPPQSSFFLYNIPYAVVFLPSQNYYQYLIPNPLEELGTQELPRLTQTPPDYLITTEAQWDAASSTTFARYSLTKDIDGNVFASRAAR